MKVSIYKITAKKPKEIWSSYLCEGCNILREILGRPNGGIDHDQALRITISKDTSLLKDLAIWGKFRSIMAVNKLTINIHKGKWEHFFKKWESEVCLLSVKITMNL